MDTMDDPDPMMMNSQFESHPDEGSMQYRTVEARPRGNSRHSNLSGQKSVISKKSVTAGAVNEKGKYAGEEEDVMCGRFPHMDICASDIQCSIALKEINLFEVYPGIIMGPYQSGFKTRQLIE